MPQKWETPEWMLPLTIPLSADTILVADLIATGYTCPFDDNSQQHESIEDCNANCINGEEPGECIPLNTIEIDGIDYFFTYNQDMISEEEAVEIPADLFTVPALGELPVSVDPINIEISSTDDIPNSTIDHTVSMSEFYSGDLPSLDCIPFNEVIDQPSIALNPISPYSTVDQMILDEEILYVESINHIIANGYAQLTVYNGLPFTLDIGFQLKDGEDVWITHQINSLQPAITDSDTEPIVSDIIPRVIDIVPTIDILNPESCDVYFPLSDLPVSDSQCIALCYAGLSDSCNPDCQLTIDSPEACETLSDYVSLDNISVESLDYTCSNCEYEWIGGECQINANEKGWEPPNNINTSKLNIEYDFVINGGALDVSINMNQEIDGSQELNLSEQEGAEGVDLIGAEFSDTPNEDEINKLNLKFRNNLFSEIDLRLIFQDFYDLNGEMLEIDIENQPINEDKYFTYDFSLHTIGAPGATIDDTIDEVTYQVIANLIDESVIIEMDTPYDFEFIDATLSSFQFENLRVKLQEFDTGDEAFTPPPTPAGFSGFELPELQFIINLFNEINAPITLDLTIAGVSEGITIEDCNASPGLCSIIEVKPEIVYYGSEESIVDTSILKIWENFIEVVQYNPILMETVRDTTYFEGENPLTIYDVFERDEIAIEGAATLDGEGTLQPGRKVWGDIEIIVDPLTLIITENLTFISEKVDNITPINSSEDSEIDSAIIDFTIENAIPLDGNISMIISDTDIFPICLDTLVQGDLSSQQDNISALCYDSITNQFSNGSTIGVTIDELSGTYDFHYIELDNCSNNLNDCQNYFYGKFANIPLQDPVLNEDGLVISPATYTPESIQLLGDEFDWFSKADILYIVPQVTLLSSEDKRTLQSINYLTFNSSLMLLMNMHEVIE